MQLLAGVGTSVLAALIGSGLVQARFLVNDLSFGMSGRIGHAESPDHIPHYIASGQPHRPDILSNKVILTPVSPGNQRGAIWGERQLMRRDWVADVDFRASGPERAKGNLNIWLAKDGGSLIGSNSVYTVTKFEGLVLVIDQHGNTGGMLRGFLNDGSIDFSKAQSVDSLAFGHCFFSYRNLGRPAQVKFQQDTHGLKVEVDGHLCFESNKIVIPEGYSFGITAATPEIPDSFEIFKLVVLSDEVDERHNQHHDNSYHEEHHEEHHEETTHHDDDHGHYEYHDEDAFKHLMPDENADTFKTSKAQFQDLHNRLQSTTHQLAGIYQAVARHQEMGDQRHTELRDLIKSFRSELSTKMEQVADVQRKVQDLQRDFSHMRDDITRRMQNNDNSVRDYLSDHHRTLSQTVSDKVPGHGRLIFILVGSQIVLAGAYVVYKRRKANSPKKYL